MYILYKIYNYMYNIIYIIYIYNIYSKKQLLFSQNKRSHKKCSNVLNVCKSPCAWLKTAGFLYLPLYLISCDMFQCKYMRKT